MTATNPDRITISCRNASCGRSMALPPGRSGPVICPACHSEFWTTTQNHNPFIRALRISLHNQEGIASTAALLLALAALWLGVLWMLKDTYAFTTQVALLASLISYFVLWMTARRVAKKNALSEAVTEAKMFFMIFAAAAAVFMCLSLWRTYGADAISASDTIRDLELRRDRLRLGQVVKFLGSTTWKVVLLGLLIVAILTPMVRVRSALRNTSRWAGKGARRFAYILAALSAFTFSGALHDGNVGRSEAILNLKLDAISDRYDAYVAAVLPVLLDEITDDLMGEDKDGDDDDDDGSPPITEPSPTAPRPPSLGAPLTTPGSTPPGTTPARSQPPATTERTNYRLQVLRHLERTVQADTERVAKVLTQRLSGPGAEIKVPASTTVGSVDNALVRSPTVPHVTPPAAEAREVRGIVKSSLGLMMSRSMPKADTLLAKLDGVHPLQGQLRNFTGTIVDGPVQQAIREIVSEAISESLTDIRKSLQECVRTAIGRAARSAASPYAKFKDAARNLSAQLLDLKRGRSGTSNVPDSRVLYAEINSTFEQSWTRAIHHSSRPIRAAATDVNGRLEQTMRSWSGARRAAVLAPLNRQLAQINYRSRATEVNEALSNVERQVLGTSTIKDAAAAESLAKAESILKPEPVNGGRIGSSKLPTIISKPKQERPTDIKQDPAVDTDDPIGMCACSRGGGGVLMRRSQCAVGAPC